MAYTSRVYIIADDSVSHWQRVVAGFCRVGHEHGWIMRFVPARFLEDADAGTTTFSEFPPDMLAVASGRLLGKVAREYRTGRPIVVMDDDMTCEGLPSVVLDDPAIGETAAGHLIDRGFRHFSAMNFCHHGFGARRLAGFRKAIAAAGLHYHGGGDDFLVPSAKPPSHENLQRWLRSLPRPCGIMAGCDSWGGLVADECRIMDLPVPEQIAIVGVDNNELICHTMHPPLSSVILPWPTVGQQAARILADMHAGHQPPTHPAYIEPQGVAVRQSSDIYAIDDRQVAETLAFVRTHAAESIAVPDILRSVPARRRNLEQRFRKVTGRTIMEEVRRVRMDMAKRLLSGTELTVEQVARRCGYASATKLGIIFKRETGLPPSDYRRKYHSHA